MGCHFLFQCMKVKSERESEVMSDSSQPHGLQPTRILCPWDLPGRSTGVGCHCLLRRHLRERQKPELEIWTRMEIRGCSKRLSLRWNKLDQMTDCIRDQKKCSWFLSISLIACCYMFACFCHMTSLFQNGPIHLYLSCKHTRKF